MRNILRIRWSEKLIIGFLVVSFAAVLALAVFVHFSPLNDPDIIVSRMLQSQNPTVLAPLMRFVSLFGDIRVAVLSVIFSAAFFAVLSRPKEALFVFLTLPASGSTFIFKLLVNRPRPEAGIVEVAQRLPDPGFPSGHAAYYVIFFGFIFVTMFTVKELPFLVRLAAGALSIALIFSVSFSRVYMGVHWMTDVIGGYFLGFAMLMTMLYFYFRDRKETSRD